MLNYLWSVPNCKLYPWISKRDDIALQAGESGIDDGELKSSLYISGGLSPPFPSMHFKLQQKDQLTLLSIIKNLMDPQLSVDYV